MSKKEQLNRAFSQIDDEWIEWAANAPKNKKILWEKCGALAVAVSILICISIGAFHALRSMNSSNDPENPIYSSNDPENTINSSNVSKNGWKIVDSDESTLTKTKTGINGFQYTLCIDYAPVETLYENVLCLNPGEDIFCEMTGQWIASQLSFDYEQHFVLFGEAFLNDSVYRDFEKIGLTPEEACQKIAQVANDVMGLNDFRVEYRILDIKNTHELLQQYIEGNITRFQSVGLNAYAIEDVCEYTFEEVNIYLHDIFMAPSSVENIVFYKYEGEWYISPEMLEDDLCIDLVQSEKGEDHGYYKPQYMSGQVNKIENGYAVIGTHNYFLIKDADIAVGDYVRITYYSTGGKGIRVSDGEQCNIGVIAEIEKINPDEM